MADLRVATAADAERLGRQFAEGVEVYLSFAPPGWALPSASGEAEHLRALLGGDEAWCLLAEEDGRVVGQVTILPAAVAARPVDDPSLAHLRNLIVSESHWGTGLARDLHAAALEAGRERGFSSMRLFTPAAHGRARRFYEREGWEPLGEEFHDPVPDLVLIEYRRPLH
jgi:GNAT superfamily N-acetyltransferase